MVTGSITTWARQRSRRRGYGYARGCPRQCACPEHGHSRRILQESGMAILLDARPRSARGGSNSWPSCGEIEGQGRRRRRRTIGVPLPGIVRGHGLEVQTSAGSPATGRGSRLQGCALGGSHQKWIDALTPQATATPTKTRRSRRRLGSPLPDVLPLRGPPAERRSRPGQSAPAIKSHSRAAWSGSQSRA